MTSGQSHSEIVESFVRQGRARKSVQSQLSDSGQVGISAAYDLIATVLKSLASGREPTAKDAALVENLTLAGQRYSLRRDPHQGVFVQRMGAWASDVIYRNPFPEVVGSDLTVLAVEHGVPSESPSAHVHPGEEFVYVTRSDIEINVFTHGAKGDRLTKRECNLSSKFPHNRGVWFRSDLPHFGIGKSEGARCLAFFSHPQGFHRSSGSVSAGIALPEVQQLSEAQLGNRSWYESSGIIATIKSLRQRRGLTTTTLANLVGVHPSIISRIENGKLIPDFDELVDIASSLNVSLSELLPLGGSFVHGCYLHDAAQAKKLEYETTSSFNSLDSHARVLIPYRWKGHGNLRILLAGNPMAKRLLPFTLYCGQRTEKHWGTIGRVLGEQNKEILTHKIGHVYSHGSSLLLYAINGSCDVAVTRFPQLHLMPYGEANIRREIAEYVSSRKQGRSDECESQGKFVDFVRVPEGGLLFVRTDYYAYSLLPSLDGADDGYKLLGVIHRSNGVGNMIALPKGRWQGIELADEQVENSSIMMAIPADPRGIDIR